MYAAFKEDEGGAHCGRERNTVDTPTDTPGDTPTPTAVCSRMRHIIARNLAGPPGGETSEGGLVPRDPWAQLEDRSPGPTYRDPLQAPRAAKPGDTVVITHSSVALTWNLTQGQGSGALPAQVLDFDTQGLRGGGAPRTRWRPAEQRQESCVFAPLGGLLLVAADDLKELGLPGEHTTGVLTGNTELRVDLPAVELTGFSDARMEGGGGVGVVAVVEGGGGGDGGDEGMWGPRVTSVATCMRGPRPLQVATPSRAAHRGALEPPLSSGDPPWLLLGVLRGGGAPRTRWRPAEQRQESCVFAPLGGLLLVAADDLKELGLPGEHTTGVLTGNTELRVDLPAREGRVEGGEGRGPPVQECEARLEQMLATQSVSADSDQDSTGGDRDRDGTSGDRERLRAVERAYRVKLQAYQEGQQRQAQLVHRLQNKVLQYKKRCEDLEERVLEKTSESERLRLSFQGHIDSAQRLQREEQDLRAALHTKEEQLRGEHKRTQRVPGLRAGPPSPYKDRERDRRGNSSLTSPHGEEGQPLDSMSTQIWNHLRCDSLSQVNSLLRLQLERATATNQDQASTNQDLVSTNQELAQSLERARQDAELSGSRLRLEQETCTSQLGREQARVRALWCQAAALRTTATQLRAFTDSCGGRAAGWRGGVEARGIAHSLETRETSRGIKPTHASKGALADMRGDCVAAGRQLQLSCVSLEARARQDSASSGVEVTTLQTQLREKLRDAMQLQGHWDAEKVELNSRIAELSDMVKQLRSEGIEKDGSLASVQLSLDRMKSGDRDSGGQYSEDRESGDWDYGDRDSGVQDSGDREYGSEECGEMEALRAEIHELQQTIRQVQQMVGCEGNGSEPPVCSSSPQRTSTLMALQRTLSRHHTHSQDLRGRLDGAMEQVGVLRGQLQEEQAERRRQEQDSRSSLEESQREAGRSRSSLELLNREKASVEEVLLGVQQDLEEQRSSSLELRRQRDLLERQLAHQHTETQRGRRCPMQSRSRREAESQAAALRRAASEREELAKTRASLEVQLSLAERKTWTLTQDLAALRVEKESLAATVFESQELASSLEEEQGRLEEEKCGLLQAKEALTPSHLRPSVFQLGATAGATAEAAAAAAVLFWTLPAEQGLPVAVLVDTHQGEVGRLQVEAHRQVLQAGMERESLEARLVQMESSHQLSMSGRDQIHHEQLQAQLRDAAELELQRQAEELRGRSQERLQQEISRMQQDCKQSLLQAETHKQQALLQKEAEKAVLVEKLSGIQQDLVSAGLDLQRARREAQSRLEQDKISMAALQGELQQLQTRFQESLVTQEKETLSWTEQIRDLTQQRDQVHHEVKVLEGERRQLKEELQEVYGRLSQEEQKEEETRREAFGQAHFQVVVPHGGRLVIGRPVAPPGLVVMEQSM
ncbi:hypothetical protein CRUP_015838 [Coryphaenoides rupestris]|nr:hypothetical protein CRUP_015838 [Coryphaenoides rupestris]